MRSVHLILPGLLPPPAPTVRNDAGTGSDAPIPVLARRMTALPALPGLLMTTPPAVPAGAGELAGSPAATVRTWAGQRCRATALAATDAFEDPDRGLLGPAHLRARGDDGDSVARFPPARRAVADSVAGAH